MSQANQVINAWAKNWNFSVNFDEGTAECLEISLQFYKTPKLGIYKRLLSKYGMNKCNAYCCTESLMQINEYS